MFRVTLHFFVAKTQIICNNNKTCAKQKRNLALFPIYLITVLIHPILRKQCVNKLFQLGVFSEFYRKPRNSQLLDTQQILVKRAITEHHLIVLIIWRSLVQAQAGPQTKRLILNRMEPFLFADPPDMNLLLLVDLTLF